MTDSTHDNGAYDKCDCPIETGWHRADCPNDPDNQDDDGRGTTSRRKSMTDNPHYVQLADFIRGFCDFTVLSDDEVAEALESGDQADWIARQLIKAGWVNL